MPAYTPPPSLVELHQLREKMTKRWNKMPKDKVRQEIQQLNKKALQESGLKQIQIAPGISELVPA